MADTYLTPTYAQDLFVEPLNDSAIEQNSLTPRAVQQAIYNRLDLDARNSSDLGSYICDYMDPECDELIKRTIGKVYIDHSEYPQTSNMGDAVAEMIQKWYGGTPLTQDERNNGQIVGTVTIGSSEAIMLGLMAARQNWQARFYASGVDTNSEHFVYTKPVLMYARDVHTCWDKYSQYYNTPALVFDLSDGEYLIQPSLVQKYLNYSIRDLAVNASTDPISNRFYKVLNNNFGISNASAYFKDSTYLYQLVCCVGCVIGTTFTGQGDPVGGVNDVLSQIQTETGYRIPIHVDAASGGFVVPFTNPEQAHFRWMMDKCDHVDSMNVSNHKFGMVYPGCGTVVFRNADVVSWKEQTYFPSNITLEPLIYHITYLGGNFTDYTVNFSRGSATVLGAYYNLKRFGLEGYEKIATQCVQNAQYLQSKINAITTPTGEKPFTVISDTQYYPMVIWEFSNNFTPNWTLTQLSNLLEEDGWKLPAYQLPYTQSRKPDGPWVMRVVTRQDVSAAKIDILAADIQAAVKTLEDQTALATSDDAKAMLAAEQERVAYVGSGDYR